MSWEAKFSSDAGAIEASEIRELLKILGEPGILSFAGGIPDPDLFPMPEVARISRRLEAEPARYARAMQYSQTEGYQPLREWIAARHSTPEITLSTDNVLVTNGAQQSLMLLAMALINADAPMAVANPTYLGALQVFGTRRPRYLTVETDADGLVMDSLEAAFKDGARMLYTIPDFQNPGGISISAQRRQRIIKLAHQYDVTILEDVAYRTLYYDAPPPLSLLELEGQFLGSDRWQNGGLVIQLGTVSKTMMPGLRVGWTIAPATLLERLVLLKQASDLHTATYNQILAHELATTILDDHVITLRETYGERRNAMVATLRQCLPQGVHFTEPKGGMFVWLTLPDGMDAKGLLEKALREENLAFVPGAAFHALGGGQNTLRLSFATCPVAVIKDGMSRLSSLIARECLALAA
ncbi:MAG: PLP-dependent aminotransferase family protein [Rhodospirillaceae bacterium]|jgi:DNA-binding transcriptional MocR family regulator|nr:PLP-dependent aminotransferase family protein [Rhodospirillaceae bacterium]MBT5524678.1 PLP-dependent aminotransferase family protein [Rhodospirillaceae bacterium]MBT5880093.1 PLP-dependent aminotransferase family protein [Rhodospirillaceae bacterium]MBT6591953.1 PLP-dependent aminotransferase family protein [Rhodospirillaceae bacterium]MBT6911658.1 PLP-dependent aminotransferase family protein [Rhodospirillaceae bacterium]